MEDYRLSAKPKSDEAFPKTGDVVWERENDNPWWVIFVWREKLNKRDQRITVQRISKANTPFIGVRSTEFNVIGQEEVVFFKEFQKRFTCEKPEFPPTSRDIQEKMFPQEAEGLQDWTFLKNTLKEMISKIDAGTLSDSDIKTLKSKITKPRK